MSKYHHYPNCRHCESRWNRDEAISLTGLLRHPDYIGIPRNDSLWGKFICALVIISLILCRLAFADDESSLAFDKDAFIESAKNSKVVKLGLLDCVAFALKSNSEIQIKNIEPKLRKDDVTIAKSAFEPTIGFEYLRNDNTEPSAMPFIIGNATNKTKNTIFNADISGRLTPGTLYSIEFLNSINETNSEWQTINPAYTVEPKITITQPILRNFGIAVNTAGIVIAKNTEKMSGEDFKNTVMEIISNTKTAYYNYIYAKKGFSIARAYLKRTHELLKINKARYKKGLISSVDLLETQTAFAQRRKALIYAESFVKKTEDNLKLITNMVDDPFMWNARIDLIDMPEFKKQNLDLIGSMRNAFNYRPDYKTKKIDLENRDILIMVAKNTLLPTLDLLGSFGLNGLGDNYSNALDSVKSDYKDWTIGAKLSIPWGSGDRANYDKTKLEKRQALIAFKRMEQNIILEVRDKVREIDIQYRQVQATKLSKIMETQNYKAQMERYREGQVSTHDMLDYQYKLSQAELDYTEALIEYNKALINLDKAEGLTLEKNNIKLEAP